MPMTEMERRLVNAVRGLTEVVEEIARDLDHDDEESWEKLKGIQRDLRRNNWPAEAEDSPEQT
jgi:hypothetical protein